MAPETKNSGNSKNTNLFKPLNLSKNITLQHRAVLGPLTRFRADSEHALKQTTDYTETEEWKKFIAEPANKTGEKTRGLVEEYYHQRSQRPGTLVITEGTFPFRQAGGYDFAPGIYSKKQVESLAKVAAAVHANGSYLFVQFWNLGRVADPSVLKRDGLDYVSASDKYITQGAGSDKQEIAKHSNNLLRPLSIAEIEAFKKNYVTATRKSFEAGADGVEIHAAGGYLINGFFDKGINKRSDKYGSQSFENRARFYLEIFDLVVSEFGADRVGTKFSPFTDVNDLSCYADISDTIAFYSYLVDQLEQRRQQGKGPVYLCLQEPRLDEVFSGEISTDYGVISNEFAIQRFGGVIIRAGNFSNDFNFAQKAVNNDDKTLLLYGRHFISNPDLVDRLENNWPLNGYDRSTFYASTYKGYVDYPYYKKEE